MGAMPLPRVPDSIKQVAPMGRSYRILIPLSQLVC